MKSSFLLALLLGTLLIAAPFTNNMAMAQEDEPEEPIEELEEGEAEPEEADDGVDETDVVVLTADNFDTLVKPSKYALVEFYAPWCGHCKSLKPEYAKAATAIKAYDAAILLAKVDATAHAELGSKFKVEGYPTLKWFVDGELASDYNGPRDAKGIAAWIKKKTGPPAATLKVAGDLSVLEAADELIVVGYFKDFKGDEFEAFQSVAKVSEDATFVQTTSAEVAKAAGVAKAPGVAFITNFEGAGERVSIPLKGSITADSIKELVAAEKLPLILPFNDKNSQKIFGSGIDRQALLVASAADLAGAPGKAFKVAAAAQKGKLVFVTVDTDGESKDPVVNFFGLADVKDAVVVGFEMSKSHKFRLHGDITEASLKKFTKSLVDGTAIPEYKSAPIPEEPLDGGVTVVVGKNFDAIVNAKDKDVLLEVYAPWCGHCKSLEPIYKKLAKRFKNVDSVVIAKMDGTENEHADVEVKGFPTLVFFPAGGKDPVSYEGQRNLIELTKFIKAHATLPYELPKKAGTKAGEEEEEEAEEAEEEGEGEGEDVSEQAEEEPAEKDEL